MVSRFSILLLLLNSFSVAGFSVSRQQQQQHVGKTKLNLATVAENRSSRRDVLVAGAAAVFGAAILGAPTVPAFADVSDGTSLPEGAAQFSRLIRVKNDLKVIINYKRCFHVLFS
jgi:hypothetical protein